MVFIFSTPVLIRHLWQLKAVGFLHWCLICAVLLNIFSSQLNFENPNDKPTLAAVTAEW